MRILRRWTSSRRKCYVSRSISSLSSGARTVSIISLRHPRGAHVIHHLGSLVTPATWMRNFVHSHPAYKHDSVVSQEINYDLFVAMDEMYVPHHFFSWVRSCRIN